MKNNGDIKKVKDWYLSNFKSFEDKLNGQSDSFLHSIRKDAVKKLEELNFPTLKDEEWKYTNVSPILKQNFTPSLLVKQQNVTNEDIEKKLFSGFDYHLMVFINGVFSQELSNISNLPDGIIVDSLANSIKNDPDSIQNYLNKFSKVNNAFNALNTAYFYDGAVIVVPDGKIIEKPIQILFINGNENENVLSIPRNLIIAGKNSQVKIIMTYYGFKKNSYFTNVVNEVFTDEDSIVDLYKVQHENENSYHIDSTEVYQSKSSVFNHYSLSFGGALVRNDINSTLNDENIECHYYGLYLANGKQHVDNHTFVDHAKPNCMSNELYKGILEDEAHGVFNGKIMVRQDAQKTNAFQSNKTILLSDSATIDTKPQLEIYADDVKCSHGATIGHIDDEAYFYIRSRGIPAATAKSMLIRAFANEVIEAVKIEPLKEQFNHMIFEHLHRIEK
jgi:Fe-S cluster assembly protein SufD